MGIDTRAAVNVRAFTAGQGGSCSFIAPLCC
jgi:hypothetical protein